MNDIVKILEKHKQAHLLNFWDKLNSEQRDGLLKQIKKINFDELTLLINKYVLNKCAQAIPENLSAPDYYPAFPKNDELKSEYKKAEEKGIEFIKNSKVAAFTVAGGQGTRLGYDAPKGTYPITPVKNKSLFQYFAEKIAANQNRYGCIIPWYIMTSTVNDAMTRNFFSENDFFGLDCENVKFLVQGEMPAIDYEGKIIMNGMDSISFSPNGHGGSLLALKTSGALEDMRKRGVECISYFQVDNPLVSIINPLFIGLHYLNNSDMSSIALSKTGPYEKLGNYCISDGKLMIIEYSDLPEELAEKRNDDGKLEFSIGSPAIHLIKRDFIEKLTAGNSIKLPWHRADKKVNYITDIGEIVEPDSPNAVKLETFIFDALPFAENTMLLEAERENEFAPVKNKAGVDSADSCRKMLIEKDASFLEQFAGVSIPRNSEGQAECVIELSPLKYLDCKDIERDNKEIQKVNIQRNGKVYYG